jgi:hypothetical protein
VRRHPEERDDATAVAEPVSAEQQRLVQMQQSAGNQAVCRMLDVLTDDEEDGSGDPNHLDDTTLARNGDGGTGGGTAGADAGTAAPAAPAAVPVNLRQIVTPWAGGANKYGFQVKFQCSSSSGSVADLQAQAPNLVWREYVTYSRNDFAHRISPSNPTILPPGGVTFAPGNTTIVNPNLLEFAARDTHWTPTSAVRDADFATGTGRALPAVMQSHQVYQFSTDGSTWSPFAGPYELTRTFAEAYGPPAPGQTTMPKYFTTTKTGVHTITEDYKP